MYPRIADNFIIRGTEELPRLVSTKSFEIYPIDRDFVDIIRLCDGANSVSDIANTFDLAEDDLREFINQFVGAQAMNLIDVPDKKNISVSLGKSEPWLSDVHIDLTDRCNLAGYCPHCYRGDKLNGRLERSLSDWMPVIDRLKENGIHRITISGGEAFLREDLFRFVEYVVNSEIFISGIFTNGTISGPRVDSVISYLESTEMRTVIYVSLDGHNASINDMYRGSGSFIKTIGFIKKMAKISLRSNLSVTVNSQINVHNVNSLLYWYEMLGTIGIDRWRMNAGRITGRLKSNSHLIVSEDKLGSAYVMLIKRFIDDWKKGSVPFKMNVESFFRSDMLDLKQAFRFDDSVPICEYKKNACSIEPNGDVQFCTSWSRQCFGNVFSDDVADIWHSDQLQNLKNMLISQISDCRQCELLSFCGGGCRLTADNLQAKDYVSCARYKMFADDILPMLKGEQICFIV